MSECTQRKVANDNYSWNFFLASYRKKAIISYCLIFLRKCFFICRNLINVLVMYFFDKLLIFF